MSSPIKNPIVPNKLEFNVSSLSQPLDKLVPFKIQGSEGISSVFSYQLECISHNDALDLKKLLHNTAQCVIKSGQDTREINGIVTYAHKIGSRTRHTQTYTVYGIRLESWMSLLANNIRSKPFVKKDLKSILEMIFKDYPTASYNMDGIQKKYDLDYRVQYNESDLNFVQRILQDSGVFFFFDSKNNKSTLYLGDNEKCYQQLKLNSPINAMLDENIPAFVTTTDIKETHYDLDSSKHIVNTNQKLRDPSNVAYVAEYHLGTQLRDKTSSMRAEQMRERVLCEENTFHGLSTQPVLEPGKVIYKQDGFNCLITKMNLNIEDSTPLSSNSTQIHQTCKVDFQYMDATLKYYSNNNFIAPKVFGTQNALVVGPKEGEVYSDNYGRLKLKFFWDNYSKDKYDSSSCWVRIAQLWAGNTRGSHFIPHVGDEVIVSFLNGNLEEPVVIGSLYNSTQKPFIDGKEQKTVHGLQSAQGHAILFDDKEGSHKVTILSKKDLELNSSEKTALSQKTFELNTTDSTKLKQKTLEISSDESVKITAGVGGASATVQMENGSLVFKAGPTTSLKMSSSGEFSLMGNLEVVGNIIATGEVHGTNI